MIAAKKISRVEFGFELNQSTVIKTIGFAHAMIFTFIQRIYIDLTSIEWLHGSEKACNPFQIGLVFVGMIPEGQDFEVIRVAAQGKRGRVAG